MKIADSAPQVIIVDFIKMCVLTLVQAQVLVPVPVLTPVPNANTVKAPIDTRVIVAIVI